MEQQNSEEYKTDNDLHFYNTFHPKFSMLHSNLDVQP